MTLLRARKDRGVELGDPCAVLKLANGEVQAPLVVGYDGARSIVRKAAGLRFEGHDYDATAIFDDGEAGQAAQWRGNRQVFLSGGPMAVLPLKDDRANLIWTEKAAVAEALLAIDDQRASSWSWRRRRGISCRCAKLWPARRHSFPIGLYVAERFDAHRVRAGRRFRACDPSAGRAGAQSSG